MNYPKPSDLVIAHAASGLSGGAVRVHRYGASDQRTIAAQCGWERARSFRDWHWIQFQTIAPEKVLMCKRGCWQEETT